MDILRSFTRRALLVSMLAATVTAVAFASAPSAKALVPGGSPTGGLDAAVSGNVYGWAVDPDAGQVPIRVRVDKYWWGTPCSSGGWNLFCLGWEILAQASVTQTANLWYAGLSGTIYGPYHAYRIPVPTAPSQWMHDGIISREEVVVTAVNVGAGTDTTLADFWVS